MNATYSQNNISIHAHMTIIHNKVIMLTICPVQFFLKLGFSIVPANGFHCLFTFTSGNYRHHLERFNLLKSGQFY